jgi:hypothetical protein
MGGIGRHGGAGQEEEGEEQFPHRSPLTALYGLAVKPG